MSITLTTVQRVVLIAFGGSVLLLSLAVTIGKYLGVGEDHTDDEA